MKTVYRLPDGRLVAALTMPTVVGEEICVRLVDVGWEYLQAMPEPAYFELVRKNRRQSKRLAALFPPGSIK